MKKEGHGDPLVPGPVMSSTFHMSGDPSTSPFRYGRYGNPTWSELESRIAEREGGRTLVFSSGMAALTGLLTFIGAPGDQVLIPSDGYFSVRKYARDYLARWGVVVREVPTTGASEADFSGVRLALVETPSNPGLDVCDLKAVSDRAAESGCLVAVDNTTATAASQRPLALGASISVASGTKAMSGHSDVLYGYVSANNDELMDGLHEWRILTGAILGPMEAWLAIRGLSTLDLRYGQMSAGAVRIARFLDDHIAASSVRYPGLSGDPAHEIASAQMDHFGHLIGFTLESKEAADRFLEELTVIAEATSFGGAHSTAERRARWGSENVEPGFVRLSVGLEDPAVLEEDLDSALAAAV